MGEEDEVVLIYTVEYYSSIKKQGIMPFVSNMNGPGVTALSELSQAKTYIVWNHNVWDIKKNDTGEFWL